MNLTFEGEDSLLRLLLVTASAYYVTQIKLEWHDVFACTLLHRELRDYSLEQIAFVVYQALFAIIQLLFHVNALLTNALLTSACKQV